MRCAGCAWNGGAWVVGSYFFGAGAAAPPACTITQMVTPVKGVTALVNPISAYGGADAEDEAQMKKAVRATLGIDVRPRRFLARL